MVDFEPFNNLNKFIKIECHKRKDFEPKIVYHDKEILEHIPVMIALAIAIGVILRIIHIDNEKQTRLFGTITVSLCFLFIISHLFIMFFVNRPL